MELIVEPRSCWSAEYVLTLDGELLGSVDTRVWGEGLEVRLAAGREYTLEKEGWISSHFKLRDVHSGRIVGEAQRDGLFSTTWSLRIEGRPATLERKGWFTRGFRIFADGREVGATVPLSSWARGFTVHAEDALPETGVLLVALMRMVIARRNSSSHSATS